MVHHVHSDCSPVQTRLRLALPSGTPLPSGIRSDSSTSPSPYRHDSGLRPERTHGSPRSSPSCLVGSIPTLETAKLVSHHTSQSSGETSDSTLVSRSPPPPLDDPDTHVACPSSLVSDVAQSSKVYGPSATVVVHRHPLGVPETAFRTHPDLRSGFRSCRHDPPTGARPLSTPREVPGSARGGVPPVMNSPSTELGHPESRFTPRPSPPKGETKGWSPRSDTLSCLVKGHLRWCVPSLLVRLQVPSGRTKVGARRPPGTPRDRRGC